MEDPEKLIVGDVKGEVRSTFTDKSQVSIEKKTQTIAEYQEILANKFFSEHPIYITVKSSHTIPIRQYESAKVEITISMPVGKEVPKKWEKKMESSYQFLTQWQEAKMKEQVSGILEFAKKMQADGL